MNDHEGHEGDDPLLRRLRANAPGDSAPRQLRRRYDILREDYERLVDRLMELEERLAETEPEPIPPQARVPVAAGGGAMNLTQQLLAPLFELRDSYIEALTSIQEVVTGLDSMAAGMMKGQHPASGVSVLDSPGGETPASRTRPRAVEIETRGRGFGQMLDFQEQLASLPGVSRVSIQSAETDRASFIVELNPGE